MYDVEYHITEPDNLKVIHDNTDLFLPSNSSGNGITVLKKTFNVFDSLSSVYNEVMETTILLKGSLQRTVINAWHMGKPFINPEAEYSVEKLFIKCDTDNESLVFEKLLKHGFHQEYIVRSRIDKTSKVMFHRKSNIYYVGISTLYETLSRKIYDVIFDSDINEYPI